MSKTLVANTNLAASPANSVKANITGSSDQPTDLVLGTNQFVGNVGNNLAAITLSAGSALQITANMNTLTFSGLGKNKIINGDMRIDQRNAGTSMVITGTSLLNPTVFYTVDRFFVFSSNANSIAQRVSTGNNNMPYALGVTTGTNVGQINIGQRIEAQNIRDAINQTVTFSFYASSPTLTKLGLYVYYPSVLDNYPNLSNFITHINQDNVFTTNNTLTRYTYTFTVPAGAQNGLGIEIFLSTANGPYTGAFLQITGVQLEVGPTATPFEYRPIGTELALCQRYYEKSYNIDVAPGYAFGATGTGYANSFAVVGYGGAGQGGTAGNNTTPTSRLTFQDVYTNMVQPFKVTKRAEPAMKAYSTFTGAINSFTLTQTYNSITSYYTYVYGAVKSGYTVPFGIYANQNVLNFNGGYQYTPNGQQFSCSFQWTADAEL